VRKDVFLTERVHSLVPKMVLVEQRDSHKRTTVIGVQRALKFGSLFILDVDEPTRNHREPVLFHTLGYALTIASETDRGDAYP
jgi:hypothetical protein